jgi:hypothetical protein
VRQRLKVLSCLAAWLIATGCQWDLAQIVAWGHMFAGYTQEMTLTAAARKTFSGEMCPLCKAVQKGKQEQEQSAPKSTAAGKVKLLDAAPLAAVMQVISPPRPAIRLVPAPQTFAGRDRVAPPLPPPRAVA